MAFYGVNNLENSQMAVPIGTKLGTQHADRSENGHQLKKIPQCDTKGLWWLIFKLLTPGGWGGLGFRGQQSFWGFQSLVNYPGRSRVIRLLYYLAN